MHHIVSVESQGVRLLFFLKGIKAPLLILEETQHQDSIDRIKFHIVGGILSKTHDTGWLEFRVIANGKYTLASINKFIPSLPWYIYKYTQAPIHAFVMKALSDYMGK